METVVHRAATRGVSDHGWLKSRFSFSFADWYDPSRMGFGALRVLNDDWIAPRSGFELHAHRDMEIITIVTAGVVDHEDSMGNRESIPAGEVQVMTAGTGVAHSERNNKDVPLTLFQLWVQPRSKNLQPRYAQYAFAPAASGVAQMLVSPDGRGESILIHQDAFIHRLRLAAGASAPYVMQKPDNGAYVFVVSGGVHVAGEALSSRDAIGISDARDFDIEAQEATDMLIIEVPMFGAGLI